VIGHPDFRLGEPQLQDPRPNGSALPDLCNGRLGGSCDARARCTGL